MGLIISYFNQQTTMSKYLDLLYNVISSNMKNLQKDNILFIDNKYKAVSTFERGILNLFQVIDEKSNFAQYKIIKTYQIKNEDTSIKSINNLIKHISTLSNDKIIKIETYRIDNNNKKGKILRLYLLEEFYESISLQQLLGFFYDDHISRKLIVDIDSLYEELINLSSNILDHIDYLHSKNIRHFNMNLCNIIYCRMKHSFCIKFTDIEAGEIYRINFGNEDIKLSDMQNINIDDYHNFIIILFQLIFFIKNLSLKNAFDYTVMYDFYKTDINIIKNELDEIFESDIRLVYFKYILKFISENDYDKVREVNNIYKEIVRNDLDTLSNKELKLDILFSLIEINEKHYLEYFYKILNEYKIREFDWLIDYLNSKQVIHSVISTYINFIQLHYENNKKIDIMRVIDNSINEYNLHQEIPRMKVNGIFPLILAYLNNCDIDYVTILKIMKKFAIFNTASIVNIAEKINFNNSLLKFFENPENILNKEVIENITNILPMLR
jgi:hypothetical protein